MRRIFSTITALMALLLPAVHASAAFSADDRYIVRARQAEKENDPAMAISMYSRLLAEYKPGAPKEEQRQYADIFMQASLLSRACSRFLESLEFASLGLQAANNAGDRELTMKFLGNIGNLHAIFDDFDRAISYYRRGYRISLEKKLAKSQYQFLMSLSNAYLATGNIIAARECFQKMQLIDYRDINMSKFYNDYLQGNLAAASGEHDLSRFFHKKALATAIADSLPAETLINENWEIGKSFLHTSKPDSAGHYFDIALEIALKNDQNGQLPKIYKSMASLAEMNGDSAAYTKYRRLEQEIVDNVFNPIGYNSKRNQLLEYEEMVKDDTIEGLNKKVWIQWTLIGCGSVILLIVCVFYIILMRRNKELRFANNKLIDKNRELINAEEKNRERMDIRLAQYENLNEDETAAGSAPAADNDTDVNENKTNTEPQGKTRSDEQTKSQYLSDEHIEILLSRIRKVLKDENFIFNPDFSLNMLAQQVKSNTKYVSWVINETYSKNFKTLLNELRIQEASKRLDNFKDYGNMTIQAISEDLGYKTSASFIQAFKKIVGMTPSVYQKLSQAKSEGADGAGAADQQ